jgi:hypothetical protein
MLIEGMLMGGSDGSVIDGMLIGGSVGTRIGGTVVPGAMFTHPTTRSAAAMSEMKRYMAPSYSTMTSPRHRPFDGT